jgi:uncharacterized oligopeptide transporter (OPT) family protein
MEPIKRLFVGGSAGNEQLTAVIAAVLLLLLAIEGATLLRLTSLLTVHAFVGMLLIPVLALKVASTGWRFLRVLAHVSKLPRLVRARIPGTSMRVVLVASAVLTGAVLATATLPEPDHLQDRASGQIGFDAH